MIIAICKTMYIIMKKKKESRLEIILYIVAIIFFVPSFIPTLVNIKVVFIVLSILLSGYEPLFNGIKKTFLN